MTGSLLWPLALLVLGFVLLGVELIVLPGFGLPGILGVVSLAAGSWLLWEVGGPLLGGVGIVVSLAAAIGGAVWFARSRGGRALVLNEVVGGTAAPTERLGVALGHEGRVVSTLRPSGVVEVDGDRHDAVLVDGTFLATGSRVRVVGQEHGQLRVAPLDAPPP